MNTFRWRPDRRAVLAGAGATVASVASVVTTRAAPGPEVDIHVDLTTISEVAFRRLTSFRRSGYAWAFDERGRLTRFAANMPRFTELGLLLEGPPGRPLLPDDSFQVTGSGNYYCSGGSCAAAPPAVGFPEARTHASDGWPHGGLAYYVHRLSSTDALRVQVWFTNIGSGRIFHEFAREGRAELRIEGPADTPEVTGGQAWNVLASDFGAYRMLSYCFSPGGSTGFCEFKTGAGSGVRDQAITVLGMNVSRPAELIYAPSIGQSTIGGDILLADGELSDALAAPEGTVILETADVQWPGILLGSRSGEVGSLVAKAPTELSTYAGDQIATSAALGGWRGLARTALAWDEKGYNVCFNGGASISVAHAMLADARMRFMPTAIGFLRRISFIARRAHQEEIRQWTAM